MERPLTAGRLAVSARLKWLVICWLVYVYVCSVRVLMNWSEGTLWLIGVVGGIMGIVGGLMTARWWCRKTFPYSLRVTHAGSYLAVGESEIRVDVWLRYKVSIKQFDIRFLEPITRSRPRKRVNARAETVVPIRARHVPRSLDHEELVLACKVSADVCGISCKFQEPQEFRGRSYIHFDLRVCANIPGDYDLSFEGESADGDRVRSNRCRVIVR